MPTLDELGFTITDILETVLTTYDSEKNPHASAVGVKKIGDRKIGFKLFGDTQTYRNLSEKEVGVVNLVNDARIIVENGLSEIFREKNNTEFKGSGKIDAPTLSEYDASIDFRVASIDRETIYDEVGESKVAKIVGEVENIDIDGLSPQNFKRSDFYLIESAILASRAIVAIDNENKSIAEKKIREIGEYLKKCKSIAPDSSRRRYISKILNHLKER